MYEHDQRIPFEGQAGDDEKLHGAPFDAAVIMFGSTSAAARNNGLPRSRLNASDLNLLEGWPT